MIYLTWLRRLWPYLLAGILLVTLTGAAKRWLRKHDAAVSRDAQLAVYLPSAVAESVVVVHWDTVVVHDTVRLAHWLTRWDTVRAAVDVRDTAQVRHALAIADTTVRACRATVADLLSSCAAKDTLIATQRKIIAAYASAPPSQPPPPVRRWSLGITAGYGAIAMRDAARAWTVHTGPSVTAGLTWRAF